MKPIDYRNETWESIRGRLHGQRAVVLAAWQTHGRGTTREISQRSGIDLLSFRPRTTELVQLGFLQCIGGHDGEGEYAPVTLAVAQQQFLKAKAEAESHQLALGL